MPVLLPFARHGRDRPVASAGSADVERGTRGLAFDREIRRMAQEIIDRQAKGILTSRALAESLATAGLVNSRGRAWSESSISRMLRRGKVLGFPFILRSRSAAACERKPDFRSKEFKRAERERLFRALLGRSAEAEGASDAVLTSRPPKKGDTN